MSYDVAFDKQFIKTKDDKYFSMTLIGDSSLYDVRPDGREVMSRSWGLLRPLMTKDELLESYKSRMDSHIEDYGTDKSDILWGMGFRIPGKSSYNDMLNWLKTGMKKAITFEQMKQVMGKLSLTAKHTWERDEPQVVNGFEPFVKYYDDEDEFMNAYEEAKKNYKYVYIGTTWPNTFGRMCRKHFFPRGRRIKERITVDNYFTIDVEGFGYLSKHTAKGMYHAPFPKLKYATKKKAQKLVDKYNKKYPHRTYNVEKVNEPATILV